ncbi:unnamed protein product [Arctogadus glacialis]
MLQASVCSHTLSFCGACQAFNISSTDVDEETTACMPRASLGIPAEPVPRADSDRASRPERGSDRSGTTPLNTQPPEEDPAAAPAPSTVSVSMAKTVQMTALAPWQVQRRSTVLPDADR